MERSIDGGDLDNGVENTPSDPMDHLIMFHYPRPEWTPMRLTLKLVNTFDNPYYTAQSTEQEEEPNSDDMTEDEWWDYNE